MRQKVFKLFSLAVLALCGITSQGQYFISGQDPSSINWNQIKTENFQVIFPQQFEKEAQRLANALELAYTYDSKTLHHAPKKISVILHNFSAIGNAFVGWAPKRSELYTIPPQDLYPQDWLNQLALHEYRHVVQVDKMNQGFTKILYFLFGQQATAGVYGVFIPFWFTEGDAVTMETALSETGRGRLPIFEMEMRTQVIGRRIYSYEKAVFGSYKDYVPNHYPLGYLLVANARKRYGTEIWPNALDYVARHPYNPFAFSHGIKKASGKSKWGYYNSCMHELDSLWKIQQADLKYTSFVPLNSTEKKVYTNYRFPQYLKDSLILALKFGLADIQQFVLLDKKKKEEKIFTPGYFDPVWISAKKNLIVWSEYGFDKRWDNRRYYDILTYDVDTHKRSRLTRRKFLFAPSLSNNAEKIAAVNVDPRNYYSLSILDARTGKEINQIASPDNLFLLTPTWSEDDQFIYTIVLSNQGKAIARVDPETGTFTILTPYSFLDITQPLQKGNFMFYHGIYSGIDNIYAVNIPTKKVFQVTSSRYGAFDPVLSLDGRTMLYSDYTWMGFNVAEISLDSTKWKPLSEVDNNSIKLYEVVSAQEGMVVNFDTTSVIHPIKRYHKFTHLLNIHSWTPVAVSGTNASTINPSLTLLSQNKLSTLILTGGYIYNYNERKGGFNANVSYKAWYPVLGLSASSLARAGTFDTSGVANNYTWHEDNLSFSISQPLNLTRSKYSSGITPLVSFNLKNITHATAVPDNFRLGMTSSMEYDFSAYRLLKLAPRDLRSKYGQVLSMNYKNALNTNNTRSMFTIVGTLLFPGLKKHHSLKLTGAEQRQSSGVYRFTSPITYMRGYHGTFNYSAFHKLSIDYKFPLLYPDLRIGPVLYLKRIKTNFFYDYGVGEKNGFNYLYQSTGVEVTSDLNLFNFLAPFDLGFRYVFLPYFSTSRIEFLYTINLGGI